ncbi:hypothetical protein JKF63_07122 [Porcisia hertigi]|uniref:tRNA/rRNA methyltransferase SpoU type domain-containing protein n=1 Tax=Porcisia hertigi TaxID=2761500 RepID=A0A836LKD3_9TRYP|nr:hypothetical protein JKF63_07122 [Porcisia hertigi]
MATQASTAVARCTRPLLAYNRSGGYRWNPIPKPPPPHYDRLYGVHSVLNTLRVAAQRQQREYIDSIRETAATRGATSAGEGALSASLPDISHPSKAATPASLLHPHRAHLACLYVRDFSLEEGGEGVEELGDDDTVASVAVQMTNVTNAAPRAERRSHLPARGRCVHRKKVIPRRYTAVRCITALAKSLKVPIRFVPRAELVQLCGERRNQNIVLEASSYKPYPIKHLGEIWGAGATDDDYTAAAAAVATASTTTTRGVVSAPTNDSAGGLITVLFLEHIIDPTNIGGILRTAFFFGVDHVVLSRQCAACTAAVSRTSTGFLEHLRVYQATTSSADFLRASKQAWASRTLSQSSTTITLTGLEVIASAVVAASTTAKQRDAGESVVASQPAASHDSAPPGVNPESGHHGAHACAQERQHCLPAVRLLLLGNEDSGLPPDLLQWCTHVAHVRSPRQTRLSLARTSTQGGPSHRNGPGECGANADVDDTDAQLSVSHLDSPAVPSAASAETFDKHQHNLRRLARLRDKEVSLNVNTATAALLSALCGVVRPLGDSGGQLGLVEVQPLCSP